MTENTASGLAEQDGKRKRLTVRLLVSNTCRCVTGEQGFLYPPSSEQPRAWLS